MLTTWGAPTWKEGGASERALKKAVPMWTYIRCGNLIGRVTSLCVEGHMLFHGRFRGCPAGCMFLRDGGRKKTRADSSRPRELRGSGPDSDRRPVKRRSRTRTDSRLLGSGVRPKKKVSLSCFHTYLFYFLREGNNPGKTYEEI